MGLNSSLPTPALNITAVSVSRSAGLQLVADADAGAKVALWLPRCALLRLLLRCMTPGVIKHFTGFLLTDAAAEVVHT